MVLCYSRFRIIVVRVLWEHHEYKIIRFFVSETRIESVGSRASLRSFISLSPDSKGSTTILGFSVNFKGPIYRSEFSIAKAVLNI